MVIEKPSSKRRFGLNFATVALGAVVVIAAILFGVSLSSSPTPLPVLDANYQCVPGSRIPLLDIGASGAMSTQYGGFTTNFHASIPQSAVANGVVWGMPFRGTLTMSGDGKGGVLPRPDNPHGTVINVMCVIAFQPEHYPGVMIEGFSGGAHCCEAPVIYLFNHSDNHYVKVVDMSPTNYKDHLAFDHNQGFTPMVVGKQVLLRTGDDQFSFAFACYACSAQPIVLDGVGVNGLVDVTLQHRSLVAADARSLWKSAQRAAVQNGAGSFGILPAWVADECALGRGATASSTVERLTKTGVLSDALHHQETFNHGSYLPSLKAFLLRNDYCSGQI